MKAKQDTELKDLVLKMNKELKEEVRELKELLLEFIELRKEQKININPVQPLPWPMLPLEQPNFIPPDSPIMVNDIGCSRCGMKISGTMGYVCSHPECPIQAHITSSSTK
jgi:hypothetical protein